MVFSSLFFIFIFLPIVLLLIWLAPKRFHNLILLLASLFFYAWGSVSQSIIFIISILFNYLFGLLIGRSHDQKAKWAVTAGIIFNLALLCYFKYFVFFLNNFDHLVFPEMGDHKKIPLPIGISFYTFHALSYIIDIYRKKTPVQKNILDMALYISFFPQLIAGPIVRYIDVADQFKQRVLSWGKATAGMQRFMFGLAKKVLVANTMAYVADQIFSLPPAQISSGLAWLGIIAYTFQIYFDFSGYSDMAIGLAKVFGFVFPENFNYPYIARSVKEFWHRWHISLSTWFRDYLYIPLGGNRGSKTRTMINLLIVFLLTGFWHGASWTFVVWGLFHGTFLLIEKFGGEQLLSRLWKPVRIGYTLLVVMIGWVFFRADTLSDAIGYISRLSFIPSSTHLHVLAASDFLDAKIVLLLIIASLYSFRVFRTGVEWFERIFKTEKQNESMLFISGKSFVSIVLFLISIVYLVAGTYNPFIYFRF